MSFLRRRGIVIELDMVDVDVDDVLWSYVGSREEVKNTPKEG